MKKQTLFADILGTVTKYFLILVIVVIVGIFFSGIRKVESGNVALVLRFGDLVGDSYEEQVHEPGLLFAFPYIIDEVIMVPTGNVIEQSVTTHYTDRDLVNSTSEGGYVITGDQSIAVISASVKYVVSDPVAYALNVRDIGFIINAAVSTAMLSEAARLDVDNLLTDGKDDFAVAVLARASEKLTAIGVGVSLSTLELTNVAMPEEVRDYYDDVNAATVQAETIVERAKQYRENIIPMAEAQANSLIADARSQLALAMSTANSNLAEFWGVREEFELSPDVVKTRIYAAKAIEVMQKIGKVRVVQDGETNIFLDP